MTLNKIILIAIVLPCLSFQKGNRPKSTLLLNDPLEILNDNVKQLIETGLYTRGTPFMIRFSDTTSFDKKGNEVEIHSGWGDGKLYKSKCSFKYNNGIKEVALLRINNASKAIYKYDKTGNIIESSDCSQSGICKRKLYHYDISGQVSQVEIYNNSNTLLSKILYKYNDNGFLLEEDYPYLDKEGNGFKIIYRYKLFDEKNNWMMKIRDMKRFNDTLTLQTDTITRKITYY
ncbi:MAG TPA: hypothetical protein VK668_22460 [Mucilaginibacter sp.]|nr:hypothetical protein [Mucilaginibacter sp.]